MTVLETHLLTDLVSRKFDCLVQLHELGRQQFQLVDSGDVTQLMKLLSAKQVLITRLQDIEGELNPFREQKPEQRVWASQAARARCSELIERGQELFREIMLQEKRSETRLIERRDEVAVRLRMAHTAHQARGAYLAEPHRPQGHLDISSQS
jgi:flagellar biosynthesis/type III secretory pathway chaperone